MWPIEKDAGQTDEPTDGPTSQRTYIASYVSMMGQKGAKTNTFSSGFGRKIRIGFMIHTKTILGGEREREKERKREREKERERERERKRERETRESFSRQIRDF